MKVKRSELSSLRMVEGNEKKYQKVIMEGRLKDWVGIGWVGIGEATHEDRLKFPEVED